MPGGASALFAGACTVSEPEPAVNVSGTNRWLMLSACVVAPVLTSETDAIRSASGLFTVKLPLQSNVAGALVIRGRGPLNRYGGE